MANGFFSQEAVSEVLTLSRKRAAKAGFSAEVREMASYVMGDDFILNRSTIGRLLQEVNQQVNNHRLPKHSYIVFKLQPASTEVA